MVTIHVWLLFAPIYVVAIDFSVGAILRRAKGPFINSVTRDRGGKSRSKIERDAGSKYTENGLKVA